MIERALLIALAATIAALVGLKLVNTLEHSPLAQIVCVGEKCYHPENK